MNLAFQPLLPEIAIVALTGLALLPLLLSLRSSRRGLIARALLAASLALGLLNPALRQEERQPLGNIGLLLVDESESQGLGNRPRRTAQAVEDLARAAAGLPGLELRVARFNSNEDGSLAFRALQSALAGIPPERYAGTLLVSDGQIHDVPAQFHAGYEGPFHSLITGEAGEFDRRIVLDEVPRFALVGSNARIRFHVEESGPAQQAPAEVTITLGGAAPRRVSLAPAAAAEFDMPVDHGGRNFAELSLAPLPGELGLANNTAAITLEGIRDRLRVLLVSGEPHPGERTWRNLLKGDPSVDLVHFTILRPPEKQDGTPVGELSLIAFPTRELFVDKLKQFDLVIFDRYQRRGILPMGYLTNVAEYVKEGGAVLIASGPDFASPLGLADTPLADILPARPTGELTLQPFRPSVTALGARHPVTHGLPGSETDPPAWGRWFRLADSEIAGEATPVLAGPDGKPLLLLAHRGEGRVALLLSDQVWLWARGFEGGGPQAELLRRLAHWLMKEPELEAESLTGREKDGRLLITRKTLAETAAPVIATSPSGGESKLPLTQSAPGEWVASLAASEPGLWRLSDGTLSTLAAIGKADGLEMRDITATDAKLAPISKATGGGVVWLADEGTPRLVLRAPGRAMAGAGFAALADRQASRVTSARELPLIAGLLALVLWLGLALIGWWRESR